MSGNILPAESYLFGNKSLPENGRLLHRDKTILSNCAKTFWKRRFSRLLQVTLSELHRRSFLFSVPEVVGLSGNWKSSCFCFFFCYSFSSFLKTFFRAGVNVIVIFFAADLMIAMLSLFAPSFGDMLPRLDDFPVVFVCQCRGLIKFEYAAVKHAGKFSVLLRLIEKAFSAIPLLSYLTI